MATRPPPAAPRRQPPRGQPAGFTLLEVVVAMLVLGMIVAGLAQGLRFGLLAWDRQAAAIDRDGSLDATDRTLRRLLGAMAPSADGRQPAMEGAADRLAFTAELPAGAPARPTRLVDLILGVDARHRLVLRWTPHLHARLLAPPPAAQTTLLPGVAGLRLSYYAAAAGQPPGWLDRWAGLDPPLLVRLHLVFMDAALRWPDLIVEPMRRQDPG